MIAHAPLLVSLGAFDAQAVLRALLRATIYVANVAGGVIIAVAVVRGFVRYLINLVRSRGGEEMPEEEIRLSLGRSLSLALEFQVAADILGTALDPTLRDLEVLAAIVLLRTVLNFFLGRELREAQERALRAQAMSAQNNATT